MSESYGACDAKGLGVEMSVADALFSDDCPVGNPMSISSPDVYLEHLDDDNKHFEESPGGEEEDTSLKNRESVVPRILNRRVATLNMTKMFIGSGLLAMSYALSNASLMTGVGILVVSAISSLGSFLMIGILCKKLRCKTYRDCWAVTFGKESSVIVDVCLLMNSLGSCIANACFVTDLLQKAIPGLTNNAWSPGRFHTIAMHTLLFLLPLSHVKNLAPLKYTCFLGMCFSSYSVILVISGFLTANEDPVTHIARPQLIHADAKMFTLDSGALVGLCMCAYNFKGHPNAPVFFRELGKDLDAFTRVSVFAFSISLCVFVMFAVAGYGFFGDNVQPIVLKNYPQGDKKVLMAWLGMAFVQIFAFPMVLFSGRNAVFGLSKFLADYREASPNMAHISVTCAMVFFTTAVAFLATDISIVLSLQGATVGACLGWVFPSIIFLKQLWAPTKTKGEGIKFGMLTFTLSILVFLIGMVILIGGTWVSLMRAFHSHGAHAEGSPQHQFHHGKTEAHLLASGMRR